jgi:hypothetical protein
VGVAAFLLAIFLASFLAAVDWFAGTFGTFGFDETGSKGKLDGTEPGVDRFDVWFDVEGSD